ncbi:hypothetical protein CEXT_337861 [Caerostris extrusa]|uniref:Uncharacterized protein n=1 Tax=Caerostris extrusa TaxID=172846 RepID=A0AAV4TDH2_CAEEX|nr:hypothetical protein CEXT_337861 [Caerostris extrusa]
MYRVIIPQLNCIPGSGLWQRCAKHSLRMLEDVTKRNRARSVELKRAESTDIKPDVRIHGSSELILEDSYPILNMGGRLDGTLENKFKPGKVCTRCRNSEFQSVARDYMYFWDISCHVNSSKDLMLSDRFSVL